MTKELTCSSGWLQSSVGHGFVMGHIYVSFVGAAFRPDMTPAPPLSLNNAAPGLVLPTSKGQSSPLLLVLRGEIVDDGAHEKQVAMDCRSMAKRDYRPWLWAYASLGWNAHLADVRLDHCQTTAAGRSGKGKGPRPLERGGSPSRSPRRSREA